MQTINPTTQRAQSYIRAYNNSKFECIDQFYKRPSHDKYAAEKDCISRMHLAGGYGFRILGGNCSVFTAGYMTAAGLVVETVYNTYLIKL